MEVLYRFAALRTPFLTAVFQCFTLFGEELAVIAVVCLLYWCFDKRLAYKTGMVFFLSGLLVQAAKITFRIERPWVIDPDFHAVQSAMKTATGYSFPSGHTQGAFALYGTFAFSAKKRWKIAPWLLLACCVGLSRLYLGVHTPLDVLGAAGIALASVFIVCLLFRGGELRIGDAPVACVLLVSSAAVMIYAFLLRHGGVVDAANAADCVKAAGAGLGFALGFYFERTYIRFDPREGGIGWQIGKVCVGFAVAIGLRTGLKLLLGESLAADGARYFLLVLWVIAVFPFCFKKIRSGRRPEKRA